MKKVFEIIILVLAFYIGRVVYVVIDYLTNPEKYMFYSAPWYTTLIAEGLQVLIVIIAILLIYLLVTKVIKKNTK